MAKTVKTVGIYLTAVELDLIKRLQVRTKELTGTSLGLSQIFKSGLDLLRKKLLPDDEIPAISGENIQPKDTTLETGR
jgi:hypothetical protein